MGDDASDRSLNVHSTPRAAEMREFMEDLAARLERLERDRRIGEIMASAGQPEPPPERPATRRCKVPRDKRWLHVVRGAAVPAVAAGGYLHRHARHAILATAGAAILAGGTLTPDLVQPAPAAQVPIAVHHHHHEAAHHRRRDVDVTPPLAAVRRRRRRELADNNAVRSMAPRSPVASAPVTPEPSPAPSVTPDPVPSPTLAPGPSPTCSHPGKSCHGSNQVGDAAGALRGLPALAIASHA